MHSHMSCIGNEIVNENYVKKKVLSSVVNTTDVPLV